MSTRVYEKFKEYHGLNVSKTIYNQKEVNIKQTTPHLVSERDMA